MEFATPPNLTGNPGQPRDLQFRGPFLEMFSTEESWAFRPTQGDENQLKERPTSPQRASGRPRDAYFRLGLQ
jgi:hypothetical protein